MAPADLAGGVRLTSLGGDLFTWWLLALLTEGDMEVLLGDPAVVTGWCWRQLCLTAGLDTPRGRAELLLSVQRGRAGGVGLVAETEPAEGGEVER